MERDEGAAAARWRDGDDLRRRDVHSSSGRQQRRAASASARQCGNGAVNNAMALSDRSLLDEGANRRMSMTHGGHMPQHNAPATSRRARKGVLQNEVSYVIEHQERDLIIARGRTEGESFESSEDSLGKDEKNKGCKWGGESPRGRGFPATGMGMGNLNGDGDKVSYPRGALKTAYLPQINSLNGIWKIPTPHALPLPSKDSTKKPHFLFSSLVCPTVWHLWQTISYAKSSTSSTTWHFPASALLQEQHIDFRPLLHMSDDKPSQTMLDRRKNDAASCEENKSSECDLYMKHFEQQLLYASDLCSVFPSLCAGEKLFPSMTMQSIDPDTDSLANVEPHDVLALAKKAVAASKQAASLAEESTVSLAESDEFLPCSQSTSLPMEVPLEEEIKVRSKRLLERRSRRQKLPKEKSIIHYAPSLRKPDVRNKIKEGFDPHDPLRLFLSAPETRQLLTAKEERELFALTKLEEVKVRLQSESNREPTLVEWAEATGMSCLILQSHIHSGQRSREKMACANFRLVVHVAKQYQGKGLNLQDLLQEGSMGLMKSIEKFKPQAGCRFSTYAYWWIRQSIRKGIFQNSRTIRLPVIPGDPACHSFLCKTGISNLASTLENVYGLLRQVKNAKNLCIQEGCNPTNEELAKRVGMTVEKLESLLNSTRLPLSMQKTVWADSNTTFQEITADTEIEIPELQVSKKFMRRHIRNILCVLPPKERRIIRLRFGIEDGEPKSLSQIGSVFGITKERVRQLENRALDKLRKCLTSEGLGAYAELLI
ncbi:hypothetical protein Scep_005063 [Stephania cephalantha]|uniref:RNA polymerase sigma-70 domain-containing protein n=1 Tax=Stephania cephalantha TaxID=152367 RepID=A0AAP0KWI5_9MAGN